jgi:hypothetical protein
VIEQDGVVVDPIETFRGERRLNLWSEIHGDGIGVVVKIRLRRAPGMREEFRSCDGSDARREPSDAATPEHEPGEHGGTGGERGVLPV